MPSYRMCETVSAQCPVSATTYGYSPNLAANSLFLAIFCICGLVQFILGLRFRTYTWMVGLTLGCLLEMAGYVGRVLMHGNAWSSAGFKLQIVALVLAPSFIAGGVDLTMKHVALTFGEEWSRIRPRAYTWVFIGVDVFSILVQAAGGGIAASGETHPELLKAGDDVIVAGIALQIFQLAIFGLVALEYAIRLHRNRHQLSPSKLAYLHSARFLTFLAAITLAYFTILIRCVYRMPEMAGGWGSGLQRNEPLFLGLDGTMIIVAALALTVAHPGFFFPQLSWGYWKKGGREGLEGGEMRERKEESGGDTSS